MYGEREKVADTRHEHKEDPIIMTGTRSFRSTILQCVRLTLAFKNGRWRAHDNNNRDLRTYNRYPIGKHPLNQATMTIYHIETGCEIS